MQKEKNGQSHLEHVWPSDNQAPVASQLEPTFTFYLAVLSKICRFVNQIFNEREFITLNDNENIENVREIVSLGSLITDSYDDTKEIKRLCIDRNAMVSLTKIWKDKSISLRTKKRLLQSLVFSIASCWVLKKGDKKKIEAFELWC